VRGSGSPEWVAGGDTPAQYGKGRRRTALRRGKMGPPGIGEAVVCTAENERARREIVAEGGALRRLLTDEERGKGGPGLVCHAEEKERGVPAAWRCTAGHSSGTGPVGASCTNAHHTRAGERGGSVWGAHLWASPG
jgi:hypothetical protein